MRKVMSVAEKPSAAKSIAMVLSRGSSRTVMSRSKYNPIYEFNYNFRGQNVQMSVTSVAGHVVGLEFEEKYSKKTWSTTPPEHLFKVAKVLTRIDPDKEPLVQNLQSLAKSCSAIILWLDCDREGEAIAFEVLRLCQDVNPRIENFRAQFSALTERDVNNAMANLRKPDPNLAAAVESRMEIDLRIGAAFTRYQTTLLKKKIPQLSSLRAISYGPCQFPTLGFVVDRWRKVEAFVAEPFWFIHCAHEKVSKVGSVEQIEFKWDRDSLFDKDAATILFEKCLENKEAVVISSQGNPKSRYRPLPLSTVAMQKLGTSKLKIDSHRLMEIAEKLYNKGFISYPRTETEIFTTTLNLQGLVNTQKQHPVWGNFATELADNGKFQWPRAGKNDDKAHPPIHPVKIATQNDNGLTFDEWRVYELVTRHFLACCSRDAVGHETIIRIEINKEFFHAKGLMITEYNWLEVYPYEKWYGKTVPAFVPGERFIPKQFIMRESKTSPPTLLAEDDLITLMDQNGIGTDATLHEHIKTIQDREYAQKQGVYFKPTKLGIALVEAYDEAGIDLWKPFLRATMEANMVQISRGQMNKQEFLDGCLEEMENIFRHFKEKEESILEVMKRHYTGVNMDAGDNNNDNFGLNNIDITQFRPINDEEGTCGNCNSKSLRVLEGPNGERVVQCPLDDLLKRIPKKGEVNFRDAICPICSFQVLEFKNENGGKYSACPMCYTSPPLDMFPDVEDNINVITMPCFKCPNNNCPLSAGAAATDRGLFLCPKCSSNQISIRKNKKGGYFLGCKGYPQCRCTIGIPETIKDIQVLNDDCARCGAGTKKVKLAFHNEGALSSSITMRIVEENSVFCFGGCDQDLESLGYNFLSNGGFTPSPSRVMTPGGGGRGGDLNTSRSSISSMSNGFENSNRGSFSNTGNGNGEDGQQARSGVSKFLDKYASKQGQLFFNNKPGGNGANGNSNSNAFRPMQNVGNTIGESPGRSKELCSKCKSVGHNQMNCPSSHSPANNFSGMNGANNNNNNNRGNFSRPGILQPSWDGSTNITGLNNNNSGNNNSNNGGSKEPFCMKCKQKGHWAPQCPGFPNGGNRAFGGDENRPTSWMNGNNNGNGNNNNLGVVKVNGTCFNCGEPGHFAPKCPLKNGGGGQGGGYQGNNKMIFDEDGDTSFTSNNNNNSNKPSGNCYHCQEPGHYANNCPNKNLGQGRGGGFGGQGNRSNYYNNNNNTSMEEEDGNSKSFSSNATTKTIGNCFKCGQPGHYAPSCPNKGQQGGDKSPYKGNGGGGGSHMSDRECFKCHQKGHFANNCPGGGDGGGGQQNTGYGNGNGNKKTKNPRTGNGDPKTCPGCGHVGRHPVKSTCPMKKTKNVKKNNANQGGDGDDYGGGYEF